MIDLLRAGPIGSFLARKNVEVSRDGTYWAFPAKIFSGLRSLDLPWVMGVLSWFFVVPLPMLTSGNDSLVKSLDGWHQNFMWALLVAAGLHVFAALVHLFYYRDGVMRRMLPGQPVAGAFTRRPL